MTVRNIAEVIRDADASELRRVLIVTALPIEMRAVRAHLADLGSCLARDGNMYECGQFSGQGNEWLVVVAESGAGTHPAQSVVTYAHIEFGSFEMVLFVGIGASRKVEAPIGSVVVSNRLYFPYSGKYSPAGFSARPHSLPIDNRLVGLARKVQRDEDWPLRIVAPLRGTLPNESEYPKPYPPVALIAPIVSIEAVSTDENSELEHQINQYYGDAHALEMEGYGAVFAANLERTPSMIIRGISDTRGGKTPELDAIHQPVAAVHAAAFAFELLNMWGQAHRLEPKVGPASGESTSASKAPTLADDLPEVIPQTKETVVLNFAGSPEDFSPEKIAEITATLRQITGNQKIEVVGSEPGSFRLLVSVSPENIAQIKSSETHQRLAEAHGVELLGAVDEAQYRLSEATLAQLRLASESLLNWPQHLPDGTWISRPELDQLLGTILGTEASTTAILGSPGAGKSALLAATGQALSERNVPFLAIKADYLSSSIANEDDLQRELDLDEKPSVILARIASYRPVALLIDQLDALATYIDLKTGRLSVLLNLVRKLGGLKNMHIVLSARKFEYEHDVRLKAVRAESLTLELPAWSTVLPILEAQGIRAAGWPADAQEVLRSPQALSTFLKLSERRSESPFRTYQAMLDQVWLERIVQRPEGARLAKLALAIAEMMAEQEALWLARAKFDEQDADLNILIASGILAPYGIGGSIGFTHQTLFEHALARAFTHGGKLSSYILPRMSSLFIRPKLWAALTYLRDVETPTYENELQAIWSAPNLRLHLRHLLIEFIGQQQSPSDTEAILMEWALRSTNSAAALQAIAGSPGWFDRFANSFICRAMTDGATSGLAAYILRQAWRFAPERVITLIQEHWLPERRNDEIVWNVLQERSPWNDDIVAIAVTILKRTPIASVFVDHTVATIGAEQPRVAIDLVRAALDRELLAARAEAERRALLMPADEEARLSWMTESSPSEPLKELLEDGNDWSSLEALAKCDPSSFVEGLWPWFQDIFAAVREFEDDNRVVPGFPLAYIGDFRFEEEHSLGLPEPALLGALRVATEALAASNEDSFLAWLDANEHEDAMPAQRLFAHALAGQPQRYASRALAFLLGNTNRFHMGSIEDRSGTTKRLLRAVSPHWKDDQIEEFERAAFSFTPTLARSIDADSKKFFLSYVRQIRLELLSSLPSNRTSIEARRLIREERRRFPNEKMGVTFHGPTDIESPMSADAMVVALDDEILNAFSKLPDATGWSHPTKWKSGGNIQLSRQFATFAKGTPNRAASLIKRFEPRTGTRASGYAVEAMAENAEPTLIFDLIRWLHAHNFDGEEFRGFLARAIERLVRRDVEIDDDIVTILEGWIEEPTPFEASEALEELDEGGYKDSASEMKLGQNDPTPEETEPERIPNGSVLWGYGGLHILPNGNFPILETLTRIFLARAEHDRLLSLLNKHLTRAEDVKVWQSLLSFLGYLQPTSTDDLEQFFSELFYRFPTLKDTPEAARLLAHVQWSAPEFVRSTLEGWRFAGWPTAQQIYGELVALIAVVQPHFEWASEMLAGIISTNSQPQAKVGVAYAAVNLWNEPERRAACSNILQSMLPKGDKDVWIAVFELFRVVDEVTPEHDWIALLEVMASHINRVEGLPSVFVVDRLQTLLPHEALLVAKIARGLVSGWRTELGDLRTGTSAAAPDLVDLAITLHRLGPLTRDEGTALFEDLLEINAYAARQTLDQIDNRFNEAQRPARRRLPRRQPRHRRRASAR